MKVELFFFTNLGENKIMELLLMNGADENSTDKRGNTASQVIKNKGKSILQIIQT